MSNAAMKKKLFPPFPSRQSFFNRLLHNFVLCWRKPRCLEPPTWLVKRQKWDALFIVKTMLGSFNSCGKRGKHDSIKKRVRCIMWMTPDRLFVLSILIPLDCVIEIRLYDRVNQDSIIRSSKSRFHYTIE